MPVSDKPVTLNFKAGTTGSKPLVSLSASKAPVSLPLGFSAEDFDPGDEEAGQEPTAEDDKGFQFLNLHFDSRSLTPIVATAAKKVAPLIASKKV